ncbi:MAG: hypothetical protein CM15mP55_0430 [Hyphomicrobiales bacterium]|nr:MAG: hypothetical protein CM15mP55_0430 [Hyphomicrobiales bacterium]
MHFQSCMAVQRLGNIGKVGCFARRIDHQPHSLAKPRDHQIIANAAIGMGQQCVADAPLAQCRYAAGTSFSMSKAASAPPVFGLSNA